MDKTLGDIGPSCNSYTFKPTIVVVNGSENKQNVTLSRLFNEDLPCFTHI